MRRGYYRSDVWSGDCDRLTPLFFISEAEMLRNKALRLHIAGAAAFALLVGTSAFAESRHHSGTRGGSSSSHSFSRGGGSSHSFFGGRSRGSSAPRFDSRSFGSRG